MVGMYNYHHQHTKCVLALSPSPALGGSRHHASQCRREDSEECDAWDEVVEKLAVDAAVTFQDYVQCHDDTCTSAELTTEDIVSTVRCDDGISDEDAESDDDDVETGPASQGEEAVSNADVLQCVAKIRTFLSRCTNAIEAVHKNVGSFELFVLQQLSGTRQAHRSPVWKGMAVKTQDIFFFFCTPISSNKRASRPALEANAIVHVFTQR
ncbi:hypothetical protein HPB48_005383 [Haemaphysalis longicornis]|uniref:Uncharacterized protein n=1 Tax=Haemaphysalis longicornis TaxID=44386 RepID=A0A9J6GFC5_HAELO|nr:hypothetical protein HPB48_005383 [Haemaphysalis longicornis]